MPANKDKQTISMAWWTRWTAFQNFNDALTSYPILAHYSLNKKTWIVDDASPWAVSAVVLQEQTNQSFCPIAYASRSLTDTERKYGQIENKGLGIVFDCGHFHMYLYCREFELETNNTLWITFMLWNQQTAAGLNQPQLNASVARIWLQICTWTRNLAIKRQHGVELTVMSVTY